MAYNLATSIWVKIAKGFSGVTDRLGAESFGERLRRHREAAGLSQEELAERAGISGKAIGALERGERRRPYPATVRQIADALGLDDSARAEFSSAARPSDSVATTARPAPESTSLPHYLTSLIGRQGEMEVVQRLLRQTGIRLLTLTGPGGIGKTRLAVDAATALSDAFPDGVFFVDLTPLADASQVPLAIAQAVGARESSEHDALTSASATLRDRQTLLLLDNFEHVLDAAAECRDASVGVPSLERPGDEPLSTSTAWRAGVPCAAASVAPRVLGG